MPRNTKQLFRAIVEKKRMISLEKAQSELFRQMREPDTKDQEFMAEDKYHVTL